MTDLSGNPVVDGTHSIVVSLYDVVTGGTAKWTDSFTSVSTKNGYFNILLGSGIQNLNTLDFSVQYYIGVRVDSDSEMSPRQPLAGVPYALNIEVPVGTIMAWDKSRVNTPALPVNFVECNGQVLSDSESPYNGQTIANLNGYVGGAASVNGTTITAQMFLRGGTHSGDSQMDAFQGHVHGVATQDDGTVIPGNIQFTQVGNTAHFGASGFGFGYTGNAGGVPTWGAPRSAMETRPLNMTVVWIMRIK